MKQKIDNRQIIINKNRREDYKKILCGDVYHLDRFELRKYREFDVENKPHLEEIFLLWLENYTELKFPLYLKPSDLNRHNNILKLFK